MSDQHHDRCGRYAQEPRQQLVPVWMTPLSVSRVKAKQASNEDECAVGTRTSEADVWLEKFGSTELNWWHAFLPELTSLRARRITALHSTTPSPSHAGQRATDRKNVAGAPERLVLDGIARLSDSRPVGFTVAVSAVGRMRDQSDAVRGVPQLLRLAFNRVGVQGGARTCLGGPYWL